MLKIMQTPIQLLNFIKVPMFNKVVGGDQNNLAVDTLTHKTEILSQIFQCADHTCRRDRGGSE